MSNKNVKSQAHKLVTGPDNEIELWVGANETGDCVRVAVGKQVDDLTTLGLPAFSVSTLVIPPHVDVYFMPGLNCGWAPITQTLPPSPEPQNEPWTQSFLYVHNDWETALKIDLAKGVIGQFESNASSITGDTFNSEGHDFNDYFQSMTSQITDDSDGLQYLEVQQAGYVGVGGCVGACIYDSTNGQDWLTHFDDDDKGFGNQHNDKASSVGVCWGHDAQLFADDDFKYQIGGSFQASNSYGPQYFCVRIFNLNNDQMNQASSIYTGATFSSEDKPRLLLKHKLSGGLSYKD